MISNLRVTAFGTRPSASNILNTYHWRATDVDSVILWRGWFSIDGVQDQIIDDLALQDRETTVEEDIGLVESVHTGLKSKGYIPGPLVLDPQNGVDSEHSIATLQHWMRNTDGLFF